MDFDEENIIFTPAQEARVVELMETTGLTRPEAELAVAIEAGFLSGCVIEISGKATPSPSIFDKEK